MQFGSPPPLDMQAALQDATSIESVANLAAQASSLIRREGHSNSTLEKWGGRSLDYSNAC